jgi:hypothetical protein
MLVQFVGYMLDNIANLRGEEGDTYPLKEIAEHEGRND